MVAGENRYWLWTWLEEHRVHSIDAAMKALNRTAAIDNMRRLASEWEPTLGQPVTGTAIVVGAGLDLCSSLQCPRPECQKLAVDRLFRRAWYYFDRIVIADDLTHDVAHHWDAAIADDLHDRLLTRIDVLLYIRAIGAEDLVEFREKAVADKSWRRMLAESGFSDIVLASKETLDWLLREARVDIVTKADSIIEVTVDHPDFDVSTTIQRPHFAIKTAGELRRLAVKEIWNEHCRALAGDV